MKIQRTFCYNDIYTGKLNDIIVGLIKEHGAEIQQVIRTSDFERSAYIRSSDEASYIIVALVEDTKPTGEYHIK